MASNAMSKSLLFILITRLPYIVLVLGLLLGQLISANAKPITVTSLGYNNTPTDITISHLPYANPNAPKGGILSQSALGTFNSANPWMTTGTAMVGTDYLYDTLMTSALDGSFMVYPQLADKITYDPDDMSWVTYHVNPNAKFWDGSTVTSHDVKATFDALLTKGPFSIRSYLGTIDDIETLDDRQVTFHFTDINEFMVSIVGQFPVFAKTSIDKHFGQISLTPLMGSGPYQLDNINEGRSVTYKRDANYWGQDLVVNRGRFNVDIIKYIYYNSDDIAFEGFKAGQFHFRRENDIRRWVTAYHFPAVQQGLIKKEKIVNKNPVTMQAIVMNLRRPVFKDIRVRRAMTEAFDFELINRTLFYDEYERLQSFFHGASLAATGTPSLDEMAVLAPLLPLLNTTQKKAVLAKWQLTRSDAQGYHRKALLKARQHLLEAGFYYQDMKLYQADGSRAKVEILLTDASFSNVLLPYIRNLKRLGFAASIRLVDSSQYLERLRQFDYDMMIGSFMQGSSPGAEQAYLWGSTAADEVGNRNYSGIKNDAIDMVIAQLIEAQSRESVVTHTKVLDRLLRAGYYMVPLYGKTTTDVVYWDKYRHAPLLPEYAIGIDYWWVDKEADTKINQYLSR